MRIRAVVPAAGTGRRFGGEVPKQYLDIHGRTVMQWTLDLLGSIAAIDEIVVALHPDDTLASTLTYLHPDKLRFTAGGAERSDSVLCGLKAMTAKSDDWVLVHDVARPCVPVEDILQLLKMAGDDPVGGLLAQPVRDTLKRSSADGLRVGETVSREGMWQAQTPQLFRYGLLKAALESAAARNTVVTDEASAIEALGFSPMLVPGSPRNLKITWPDDLWLAGQILSSSR
ncbi:MAG: 2-C-methyl-D-erythritol 4-phosphate cytidylyltransferase [Fluviicoccus sp.]|uniref:2-C-methyl-D-erythritol 4-phosphate cytidylyltransferase n=1 Tax=Fluviicoccus sp. TaxID=2003552 RepID=UPI00271E31C2|nr:2-C-methyl-D-erythritol 4-phosphate cytidylyltransferase [Fluviicoccus sp.]MDO8329030.1 2-C-methyl-D-erythritol 4-phosphate cytidylyltransferase [Fluviicoccus sp.]